MIEPQSEHDLLQQVRAAIAEGRLDDLRSHLRSDVAPDVKKSGDSTFYAEALRKALNEGSHPALKILLDAGASADACIEASLHETVFAFACRMRDRQAVMLLLEAGANIWAPDRSGTHAIFRAMADDAILKDIHGAGRDLTKAVFRGRTLLHYACEYGHQATAVFLMAIGMGRFQPDDQGRTPMDYARENQIELFHYLEALEQSKKASKIIDQASNMPSHIKPL